MIIRFEILLRLIFSSPLKQHAVPNIRGLACGMAYNQIDDYGMPEKVPHLRAARTDAVQYCHQALIFGSPKGNIIFS
jgi:hypothetical protein